MSGKPIKVNREASRAYFVLEGIIGKAEACWNPQDLLTDHLQAIVTNPYTETFYWNLASIELNRREAQRVTEALEELRHEPS